MSSFKKRTRQLSIPGTKSSLQNGQLVTSLGNPSLDHIIGGGLPIGSILMIEEDRFVTYSKVLTKYFLAEGIFSKQSIFLGSLDDEPKDLLRKLPKPVENVASLEERPQPSSDLNPRVPENEMKIAWRYNDLPAVSLEQSATNVVRHFNLMEQIDEDTLKIADTYEWNSIKNQNTGKNSPESIFENCAYLNLLQELKSVISCEKFECAENSGDQKSLLRICLTSVGSPLWYKENFAKDFLKFLTVLRSIVRNHLAVCLITVPMHLIRLLESTLSDRIRNLVDFSVELESFAGSEKETNPVFREYHGLLNIKKISAVNSLAVFTPETTDLAFKLRRKKFVVEKLHLPPELQEPDQQQKTEIIPSLSCGSNQKQLLEF